MVDVMDCPHIPEFDPASSQSVEAAFAKAPVLSFSQSWLLKPDAAFASGTVSLGWRADRLVFDARLEDGHLFTRATRRNEPLFQLGDTLEFFAGVTGQESYLEYHYAPNGVILQLLWPRYARDIDLATSGGLAAFAFEENLSDCLVRPMPGGWRVTASIQSRVLLGAGPTLEGARLDLHFGRYDYSGSDTPPVLSSTAPLPRRCFHDRPNWHRIVCLPSRELSPANMKSFGSRL
jgi:hypothetical protein